MIRKTLVFSLLAMTSLSLTACNHSHYPFLYHPTLSQGNIINPAALAELKPGLTKAQVLSVAGEPILQTPLSPDAWHYVYIIREGGKVVKNQQVTLYFSNGRLMRIENK